MNPHIQNAIVKMNADISRTTLLRDQLLELGSRFENEEPLSAPAAPPVDDGTLSGPVRRHRRRQKTGGATRVLVKKKRAYKKSGKVAAEAPASAGGGPRLTTARQTRLRGGKPGGFKDKVRAVVAMFPGEFSRAQLSEAIRAAHPDDKVVEKQLHNLSLAVMDLIDRGELLRTGTGSSAIYRKGKVLAPSATTSAEKNYQEIRGGIKVPREPEEE